MSPAAVFRLDEQIFQVEARLADERGVVVEEQCKADDRAGFLGQQDVGEGAGAEEVFLETSFFETDSVGKALVLAARG